MAVGNNIIQGTPGQQFSVQTSEPAEPLGTQMVFPDGRKFRYAQAGAVAVVVGKLYQAAIPVANHVLQTATAAAVGDRSVTLALGATAVTADQYKDGYLVIDLASNTGFGYIYGIKTHGAVASSGSFVVPLKESVQVAIDTTANSVSLVPNTFAGVILSVATNNTAELAGVSVKPIAIGAWGWLQTAGHVMCLTTGTIVIGQKVFPSTTTGAVIAEAAFSVNQTCGIVTRVASTTNYSTILALLDH